MKTSVTDYYRDWRIQLELGQGWTATIAAPDCSTAIFIGGESETELFAAAVELIDRQLIDDNVPLVALQG